MMADDVTKPCDANESQSHDDSRRNLSVPHERDNSSLEGIADHKMKLDNTEGEDIAFDENGNDDGTNDTNNNEETSTPSPPSSLYNIHQRVYAKDDATGLLYPAIIRRSMWGPKSTKINVALLSSDGTTSLLDGKVDEALEIAQQKEEDEDEDEEFRRWDPKRNCHHYYVHYMGWNVKWDRWVEESHLYEDSKSTHELAARLMKEYNKVKPTKKGQKMSTAQLNRWMKQMCEIESEHWRLEKERVLARGSGYGQCHDTKDYKSDGSAKMEDNQLFIDNSALDYSALETYSTNFQNHEISFTCIKA